MKIMLVAHGYPPELVGGTELVVQGTARALAALGHQVVVVAGSMAWQDGFRTSTARDRDPASGAAITVHRIHRGDLYFDHWQKAFSVLAGQAFRKLLRAERPDVVHVHHWIRLTRDLVAIAAEEAIPAVVTLHDQWTTCLLAFRVRPAERETCRVAAAANPCVACVEGAAMKTPWLTPAESAAEFARHRADIRRELELAGAVTALSRSQAAMIDLAPDRDAIELLAPVLDIGLPAVAPLPPPETLGALVLGVWGNVSPLKGVDLVVDAVGRLTSPGLPVQLHVAGNEAVAHYSTELRRRAVGVDVQFHGAYQSAALARHPVAAVHVMVSGSRAQETWGLVIDEAVALGLPMVLPRSGAFAERMVEGRGTLFYQPGDVASLAAVLQRLRQEPGLWASLRQSLPPPATVVADAPRRAQSLVAIYERVAAAGAPKVGARDRDRDRAEIERARAWDAGARRSPGNP